MGWLGRLGSRVLVAERPTHHDIVGGLDLMATFASVAGPGAGKMYNTGDELIQVLQLQRSWREMGQQYGAFASDGILLMWDTIVQPPAN